VQHEGRAVELQVELGDVHSDQRLDGGSFRHTSGVLICDWFLHRKVILVASPHCRRFQMRDKTFHALNIIRQSFPASRRDFVSCFWPQTDEGFLARDISAFFQFAKMQIQTAINRIESLFQSHEIKRTIDLQGGHYPKPERPVNGGV
jgi:hypothetical protein